MSTDSELRTAIRQLSRALTTLDDDDLSTLSAAVRTEISRRALGEEHPHTTLRGRIMNVLGRGFGGDSPERVVAAAAKAGPRDVRSLRGMGLVSMVQLSRMLMERGLADDRWAMVAAARSDDEFENTMAVLHQREIAENTKLCRSNS